MRIGIVAGEASGDILGAGLIRALKQQSEEPIEFEGIGGPLMEAEGLQSRFPMERLSVMGLVEVLSRLRELLGIRKNLRTHWLANPPDIFIGIDAPDFNLGLERKLRDAGIATAHYVSPSIWAWRQGRVKKIARSTDLMLCLLPFERDCYAGSGVDARFVGHTLADQIPLQADVSQAREVLGLDPHQRYLALLPGSRGGEVERLGGLFLDVAAWLLERQPDLKFLLPAANQARYKQLQALLADRDLPVQLIDGRSREVMAAAEAVLIASGTATLEGMLLKKPLVISYKASPLTYRVIRSMLKVPFVGLPNLLAGEMVAPEIMQDDATVENLGQAMLEQLEQPERQVECFTKLHQQLRLDASSESAKAVLELVAKCRGTA